MPFFDSIQAVVSQFKIKTVLVDAFGVLYGESGIFPGVVSAIDFLNQQQIPVFLVTNNSSEYTDIIFQKLYSNGIAIPETHIISSGHGISETTAIRQLIFQKKVFVLGTRSSHHYIQLAQPGDIVSSVSDAQVIVLTAFMNDWEDHHTDFQAIIDHLSQYPNTPVICCNPDMHVMTDSGLYPVVGSWALKLQQAYHVPVIWMGKPHSSFSWVVESRLKSHGVQIDRSVCFFDDNPENVHQLASDLGILGGLVLNTGLSQGVDIAQLSPELKVDFVINSLHF